MYAWRMPPLPRLKVPALAELAGQLRYTPAKAARRQLEAAEALAGQVDPEGTYPEDWIVFRLTGYRPDLKNPALIKGDALLRDLSPLIEHLCIAADLSEADLLRGDGAQGDGAAWLTAEEVCARWRISRRTLDRYRREGLLARRVAVTNGRARHRLVFSGSAVEAFAAARGERLAAAAAFSRIDPDTEERIIRWAARYRARLGWSRGQVSRRLAEKTGRSAETIRQLLIRADAGQREPIFGDRAAAKAAQREVIERACSRSCGVDAAELAERLGLSPASVYRILAQRRADRLRTLARQMGAAAWSESPLPAPPASSAAQRGLGRPGPRTLAEMLEYVAAATPEGPRVEHERAQAYWRLRGEALRRAASLERASPAIAEIDEVETLLRWAARVKAEMVRSQLPLAVRTIEAFAGRPLTALPARAAGQAARLGIDAVIEGVERFDPAKGGRLAAPVSLALSRVVSQWVKGDGAAWVGEGPSTRAAPRCDPETVDLDDFTQRVCSWQAWLEPDPRVREGLGRVTAEQAALLVQRYGWAWGDDEGAGPPQTLAAIGARLGVIPARVSRLEQQAMRAALGLPERRRAGVGAARG